MVFAAHAPHRGAKHRRFAHTRAFRRRSCTRPRWGRRDPGRFRQVLTNLIGNALEAMDGQPTPRIELDCAGRDGQARLTISQELGHVRAQIVAVYCGV